MSKHTTDTAAAEISPKIKAGGWTGAALTILATALAAGIAAIPKEAWDGLGVWGVPVGVFVGALGFGIAAWAKGDPLRNLGAAVADMGQAYVPAPEVEPEPAELPADVESEPAVTDDLLTPEADALAARAAERRRTGSTAGGVA